MNNTNLKRALSLLFIISSLQFGYAQSKDNKTSNNKTKESSSYFENLKNYKQPKSIYVYKSKGIYYARMNLKKKFLIDTTHVYKGINYHSFNLEAGIIKLIMRSKNNSGWESYELKIKKTEEPVEEIKLGTTVKFEVEDSSIKEIMVRKDGNIIYFLGDGTKTLEYFGINEINQEEFKKLNVGSSLNKGKQKKKIKEPTLEEIEYSTYWRQEAYKASLKFMIESINEKPNCKVISQGLYNPDLIRYIGNFGFLSKVYFEFNCNQGYNNPSYFWVKIYYLGDNSWKGEIVKQRFAD